MATAKKEAPAEISIMQIDTETIEFHILGTSPLIMNRMSQKAWFELLAPKGRKTAADKAGSLKHDPIQEFRDSPYVLPNDSDPTLLALLPTMFKKGMGTAALRTPGVKKTEIGQLVYVRDEMTPVYGVPKVFMAITRSADMNKTPDVRTRAILPEWACRLEVTFVTPALRGQGVANLLSSAGIISGVGDWRQEKGSGSYGSFKLVNADDKDYQRIIKSQGRAAQVRAMEKPEAYNDETSEMLAWFDVEIKRRGFKVAA